MKTVILDDEEPAVKLLTRFVDKIPYLDLQLATTDVFVAADFINTHSVDLLLSDIEMPDMTGIELLNSLEKKPLVIFTTAYEQYALQGYELAIIDYLIKPIRFERFSIGISKAYELYQLRGNKEESTTEKYLFVKAAYQTVQIAFDDILYIEGMKDYVKIYTKEKMIMTRLNLKGIGEKLPQAQFIRIHRSYIIPLSKITTLQKGHIYVGSQKIPIGETYRIMIAEKFS